MANVGTLRKLAFLALLLAASPSWAADQLTLSGGTANPGELSAPVTVQGTNDLDMHSLSLSVAYDNPLIFTGIDFTGTAVEAVSPMGTPEFAVVNEPNPGEVTAGIIFELMPGVTPAAIAPSPTTAQDLVHLLFEVPGSATPASYNVQFVDGLGTPGINNIYSSAGESVIPSLTDGTLTVSNLNTFEVKDVTTQAGNQIIVPVLASHEDLYQGFQTVMTWDNTVLTNCTGACGVTGIGTDADAILRPQNPNLLPGSEPWEGQVAGGFVEIKYEPGAGGPNRDLLTVAAVFDFEPPFTMDGVFLDAGEQQSILFYTFSTSPTAPNGSTTEIRLENGLGSPPQVNFAILEGGFSVTPLTIPGTVTFDNLVTIFQRGDANSDGGIDLGDIIFILQYLFASGMTPVCLDAADINDDGIIDLSDGIFGVGYLFTQGSPPQQPFGACGEDCTTDTLDCASYNTATCP